MPSDGRPRGPWRRRWYRATDPAPRSGWRWTTRSLVAGFALAGACVVASCGGGQTADPNATPRVTCIGLPTAKCDEAVAAVARSLPNEHPVLIEVGCVSPPCTEASGAMVTTVTLADGHQLKGSTQTWSDPSASGGEGVPSPGPDAPGGNALPVEPVCVGVPLASCRDMAAGFLEGDKAHGAVVSIVVRCTKNPCTERTGEGETRITYADGTQSNGGWGYSSGG